MDAGKWLTRGTVWLALLLYALAEGVKAVRRKGTPAVAARWFNTLGCAAFLAHVACAFHFYHDWSHREAYEHTARRTAEWFGWNWRGGLYFNYAFVLLWLGEVGWSSASPNSYSERPKGVAWAVRGIFLFMIFNGAVVFAHGAGRWFGLVLCTTLMGCWWWGRYPVRSLEKQGSFSTRPPM